MEHICYPSYVVKYKDRQKLLNMNSDNLSWEDKCLLNTYASSWPYSWIGGGWDSYDQYWKALKRLACHPYILYGKCSEDELIVEGDSYVSNVLKQAVEFHTQGQIYMK